MEFPLQLAAEVQRNALAALVEDIGGGDLTALLIPATRRSQGIVISREDAVLAGSAWFDACFQHLDPLAAIRWHARDGEVIAAGQTLCELNANTRALLSAERAALNFLQMLSATATLTRRMSMPSPAPPRADRRHAQDPARPAPGPEVRRHLRRRHQPSPRPV